MDIAIAACSALFIIVLAVSAWWDPTIRTLHVAEAIPYAAAAVLCLLELSGCQLSVVVVS